MEAFDAVIVGAGPAGTATAVAACRRSPDAAGRIVVLDRARFPRHKPCGGGVTEEGLRALGDLGLVPAAPSVEVRAEEHRTDEGCWRNPESDGALYLIFDRTAFDAWLVAETRALGVDVREETLVRRVSVSDGLVHLDTGDTTYTARIVVAADGANSVVVRALRAGPLRLARLLEGIASRPPTAEPHRTYFDYVAARDAGIQGYLWTFPSVCGTEPTVNVGVYDSRLYPGEAVPLRPVLARYSSRLGELPDLVVRAHPLRRWDPQVRPAQAPLLAVGDALGSDSLMGEGISYALVEGSLAGAALVDSGFDPSVAAELYNSRLVGSPSWEKLGTCLGMARRRYWWGA